MSISERTFSGSVPTGIMAPLGLVFETGGLTEPLAVLIAVVSFAAYYAAARRAARAEGANRWTAAALIDGTSNLRSVGVVAEILAVIGAAVALGLGAALFPLIVGVARLVWGRYGITPRTDLLAWRDDH